MKGKRILICMPLFVLFSSAVLLAQVTTGTISGTVADETGAVVPGSTVEIKNPDTGVTRTVLTNEQGHYAVPNLASGTYEVRAQAPGFQTTVRRGIRLAVGGAATVDLTLQMGAIVQEIEVTGEAPLVELSNASVAGVIDDHQIRELPLNGRDFTQLAGLQAGAVVMRNIEKGSSKGYGQKIAFGGARPHQTLVLLDGGDTSSMQNFRGSASAADVQLGVESVKEFQVLSGNYGADVASFGGGVINAITRSGTNAFHGSAYEYLRNDNLDARNFFDPGEGPPEFKRNQFGASLGGPIVRDRTFFFANYEGLRERLGSTFSAGVPTAATREGRLPDRTVPVNPEMVPFIAVWPLPNGRDFGDGTAEFVWSFSVPTGEDLVTTRVDHALNDTNKLMARYRLSDAAVIEPNEQLPTFTNDRTTRNQYVRLEEQSVLTPTLVNTLGFHVNRAVWRLGIGELIHIPDEMLQFPDRKGRPFSSWSVPGLGDIGPEAGAPRSEIATIFEFSDDVVYNSGNHMLKFGFQAKRYRYQKDAPFRNGVALTFNSLGDLVTGRVSRAEFMAEGSDAIRNLRQSLFGFYFQDDARLTKNLTLNLGVRWEFTTVPTEIDGKLSNLRDPLNDAEFFVVGVGVPWYNNTSLDNVAPRFGFAWDPTGTGKTALRGGLGLYFDTYLVSYISTATVRAPPFFLRTELRNPPRLMVREALQLINPADVLLTPPNLSMNPGSPKNIHFNLTLQRELAPELGLTLAYVGSRGLSLLFASSDNSPYPRAIIDGKKFFTANLPNPNPNFGSLGGHDTGASSWYHSMRLRLKRRSVGGLGFDASYTFSKTTDDVSAHAVTDFEFSGRSRPQDPYDRRADWGQSAFDVRHSFTFHGTYDLPPFRGQQPLARAILDGWQLSSILALSSGSPLTPIIVGNQVFQGNTRTIRPDLRAGASNNPVLGGPDRYYDVGAFVLQPRGFLGNLGRNTVIGPGLVSLDFSARKYFKLGEDARINFQAEVFNILNRPNFAMPGRAAFSLSGPLGAAGRITGTATTARQLQFALRLEF